MSKTQNGPNSALCFLYAGALALLPVALGGKGCTRKAESKDSAPEAPYPPCHALPPGTKSKDIPTMSVPTGPR